MNLFIDFPAYSDTVYSDTVYSDTPLTVTLLAIPKPFSNKTPLLEWQKLG